MPNTYTQIFIQIVFTVKGKHSLIPSKYKNMVEKYITGIISRRNSKLLAINCIHDHIHILIGLSPSNSISNLVRDIKAGSSQYISQQIPLMQKFSWQEGYGAFSYAKRDVPTIIEYILNQEKHHKIRTFREEFIDFLKKFNIEYNPKYLFDRIDK